MVSISIDRSEVYAGVSGGLIHLGCCIGSIIGTVLALVYGILMVIPASPFSHQELGWGITLIVCSVVGVTALLGGCIGACLTCATCAPVCCCVTAACED